MVMRIGLGTVQFGLDYGISNSIGKTSYNEVAEILSHAQNSGVEIIDTAQGYGDSEKILGDIGVKSFKVITKISSDGRLSDSLKNLKLDKLYGLLAHSSSELLKSGELWDRFLNYKENGIVEKIGVSVYSSTEIDTILDKYPIDIIQVPVNVYDQRLIESKHLELLEQNGIEIHARSAFLQGLLLQKTDQLHTFFSKIARHHESYLNYIDENNMSYLEGSLGFIYQFDEIKHVVCGVNTLAQFKELLNVQKHSMDLSRFKCDIGNIINPSEWRI